MRPLAPLLRSVAVGLGVAMATLPVLTHASTANAQTASSFTLSASPTGTGTVCSSARPCSVDTALARARAGTTVELSAGTYGPVRVVATAGRASAATPIVVRPAQAAAVETGPLTIKVPGVVVQDITVRGTVYVDRGATGAVLSRLTVVGSGVFLRADGAQLLGSTVSGGTSVDGVQIKDGRGIRVEGNRIHSFNQQTGNKHADCIQLFDTSDVVVRGNTVYDCDNAGIIFSDGAGRGIARVLVEANFVAGCRVTGPACRYGTAIDLRTSLARDVTVRNNTFGGGSVRIATTPGLVNDRNIIGYLSSCGTPMTNSIVRSWNSGLCAQPAAVGQNGNRVGTPAFADAAQVDFRPSAGQGDSVRVAAVVLARSAAAVRDIDGRPLSADVAGAAQPLDGPANTPTPTTPTTASPTAPTTPPATNTAGSGGSSTTPQAAPSTTTAPPAAPSTTTAPPAPAVPTTSPATITVQLGTASGSASAGDRASATAVVTGGNLSRLSFRVGGLTLDATSADGGRTWSVSTPLSGVRPGDYAVTAVGYAGEARVESGTVVFVVTR